MDRTLTVFKPSGHKLAEIVFAYDKPQQASAYVTEFRQLYDDNDPDDESKSVYESGTREHYLNYRQFDSIDQIRAFDREFVRKELGRDLTSPLESHRFEYGEEPIMQRYVAANHFGVIGMANVRYSFSANLKEVSFLSGRSPKFDTEISANSLETNLSCLLRITEYDTPIIHPSDLNKLPLW